MRSRGRFIIGGLFVLAGIVFLIGAVFRINVWALCVPVGLIALGVWLLLRPRLAVAGTRVNLQPLCNIRRRGPWRVAGEDIWMLVGDVDLDFTQAEVPVGETTIRVYGFVGDVDALVPEGIGVAVASLAFLTTGGVLGPHSDTFVMPVERASAGYATAERRIRLETMFFVADLNVVRAGQGAVAA